VVREVFGAREHIKDQCGWLAQQGYFAMSDLDDERA
jgi:dienelactone hydrolase